MIETRFYGVVILFFFHAVTMFVLCPSRYRLGKTVAIWCGMILLSVSSCTIFLRQFPNYGGALFAFTLAVLLLTGSVFLLSAGSRAHTLFLLLIYMQMIMVIVFLSGYTSRMLFDGNLEITILLRSLMQLGIVILIFLLRGKLALFFQSMTEGWWPLNLLATLMLSYLSVLVMHVYADGFDDVVACRAIFLLLIILFAVYGVYFQTLQLMHNASEKQQSELQNYFLLRQVESMQETANEARRIRHDMRHHYLQIAQYARRGETEALLRYLEQYEEESEAGCPVSICENLAADNILTAYTRRAQQNGIRMLLDVTMEKEIGIRDVDLVAILANALENAVYGCLRAEQPDPFIEVYIARKASKLVIQTRNTTAKDIQFENGLPKSNSSGVGVSSILHSAARYGGETDFCNDNGVFVCRILLKIPQNYDKKG